MIGNNENGLSEKVARHKSREYLFVGYLSAVTVCLAGWSAFPDAHTAQLGFVAVVLSLFGSTLCVCLHFRFKQRLEDRQRGDIISKLEARVNDLQSKTCD